MNPVTGAITPGADCRPPRLRRPEGVMHMANLESLLTTKSLRTDLGQSKERPPLQPNRDSRVEDLTRTGLIVMVSSWTRRRRWPRLSNANSPSGR
jgi:hypothetical protein